MKKQHTQKMTVRVTAQTAYNLERLMLMSGQKTPGRVPDVRPGGRGGTGSSLRGSGGAGAGTARPSRSKAEKA